MRKVSGTFPQRVPSLTLQPSFFIVLVGFICARTRYKGAWEIFWFLTNFDWHSGFHECLVIGSGTRRDWFVLVVSFVTAEIVCRRGIDDFLVVFIVIILAWTYFVAFVHILSRRFWERPHWIFGLDFGVTGVIVRTGAGCFWKEERAVHVSSHDAADFGEYLFFWFVFARTRNVTGVVFHLNSRPESVSWLLFASILEDGVLEFIGAWTRNFVTVLSNSGVSSERVSSIFLELRDRIVLAGSGFSFECWHASAFHAEITNKFTSRRGIFIWRRSTWVRIGRVRHRFYCLWVPSCWAWWSLVFSEMRDNLLRWRRIPWPRRRQGRGRNCSCVFYLLFRNFIKITGYLYLGSEGFTTFGVFYGLKLNKKGTYIVRDQGLQGFFILS